MIKCILAAVLLAVLADLVIDHGEQARRAATGLRSGAAYIGHAASDSIFAD